MTSQRFYQQLGFTPTGRTEPYPNDAALIEFEMSQTILGYGRTVWNFRPLLALRITEAG